MPGDVTLDGLISSGTLRKTPRRIWFWVISRKKRSTMLSHEELVGV